MAVMLPEAQSWQKPLWEGTAKMDALRGHKPDRPRLLVIACGALAKEIVALRGQMGDGASAMTLQCLPAEYHNTPQKKSPQRSMQS